MIKKRIFLLGWLIALILTGCKNDDQNKKEYDSPVKGTIHISVDESFKPVIAEQIKVYQSSYPKTNIIASYKSEAACWRDLQNDSTRMIIVARGLLKDESDYFHAKLGFRPKYNLLAFDAVCLVLNINATDSVFTLDKLQKILKGEIKSQVVLDGNSATSTVRFLLDSIVRDTAFGPNVFAAQGSKAVLDYIAQSKDAIGIVGSSWVSNEDDPEQLAYSSKIKLGYFKCANCKKEKYIKPSQETLANGNYPLYRPLYCIVKESTMQLGTAFMGFMTAERGQLIFRRSYLVPGKMDFGVRNSSISE